MDISFQIVDKAPSCEGALSTVLDLSLFLPLSSLFRIMPLTFYSTIFLYRVQVVTDGSYK